MRFADTLRKAKGLLVEQDEEDIKPSRNWNVMDAPAAKPAAPSPVPQPTPAKTVEQIVRDAPGPNLEDIKPTATPSTPVIDANGDVNFGSIYSLANLPTSPFTAEQVLELLATLPKDLPIESKRATVKIAIGAMAKATGVSTEAIVTDASRKLAALAAYAKSYCDQAVQFTTKADAEIAALTAEIEQRKRSIEDAKAKQAQMLDACTHETDRLDDVLEFFSLDISPSKYAS